MTSRFPPLARLFLPCHAWALAAWLAACGGTAPSVLPDDTGYLAVGVEPGPAIDEATRALASLDLAPSLRVDAPRFSAAAYDSPSGRSAVRVATQRGTALALDAQSEEGAIFSLDPRTGTDLSGDGAADVVVVRTEADRACVALAEVDAEGVLRPVSSELRWIDPRLCIAELVDLDHDARVEALVLVPFPELGTPPPTITVPMTLDARPVFVPSAWPEGFATAEIARHDALIETALARHDPDAVARAAIELAMIAALRGGDDEAIDAPLDRARAHAPEARAVLDQAATRARALRALAAPPAPAPPPAETSAATDASP
ncbi:MAG: hypothetical protein K1X94_12120 [Sandaracinaceae bacterium]|nr:hypothetical protein [Sandaracinaceae bacterium]